MMAQAHNGSSESATPNLFIVGAPKCGTTSMYEYLRQHPQIFFPPIVYPSVRAKEPHYFCPELEIAEKHSIKSLHDYLALYHGNATARWRGDASTNYLVSELAAENIRRFCPDARILIMLRPPLAMMHSYHNELLRHGHEDIVDFHEAVEASDDRRHGRRIPPNTSVPRCLDYPAISRFAPQVERYLRVFGPAQVRIILLEDIVAEPAKTFRDTLDFLGVENSFQPEFRVHNETPRQGRIEHLVTRFYQQPQLKRALQILLPYETRRRFLALIRRESRKQAMSDPREDALRRSCAADIQHLSTLIGRDLAHWL